MNYFTMRDAFAVIFLAVCVHGCLSGCNDRKPISYYNSANNQILKRHGFQRKTVSSPVLCGRDCAISPQCQSFNYHPSTHLCVLNNATRSNNPDDLVHLLGSVYYDENVDTKFLIKTETTSIDETPTIADSYTQAPSTTISPGTSAEMTKQVTSSAAIDTGAPTTPSAESALQVTSYAAIGTQVLTKPISLDTDVPSSAAIDNQAPTTSMSPDTNVTPSSADDTHATTTTTPKSPDTSAETTLHVTSSAATDTQALTTPMSPDTDVTSSAAIDSGAPTTPSAESALQVTSYAAIGTQVLTKPISLDTDVPSSAAIDNQAPTTSMSPDTNVTSSAATDTQALTTPMSPDTDVTSSAATNTQAPTTPMASDTSAETTKQVTSTATSKSCKELLLSGTDNGQYTIYPDGLLEGVPVYCDMETDGGGWIVFQRRQDGSVDFYRNWAEYQSGFGDLNGEFWLGNDILPLTAYGKWQLLVEMENWDGGKFWAAYGEFAVSGNLYTLHIGSYDTKSTVDDSMLYHDGYPFTTKDQDNDNINFNCAVRKEGAWWFESCFKAHLNGKYYNHSRVGDGQGVQWKAISGGFYYSLKSCAMKIREVR
ncbi:tenascin-R-like [Asterias rubens]|uniref:tenascin-R-like n=1 Tax=Asterias rubens TaxID=7604 RepID=UPI001455BAD4|nr:tenascin-R-like [Asterias rubens]